MLVESHILREIYRVEIHAVDQEDSVVFRAVLFNQDGVMIRSSYHYPTLSQAREELGFYSSYVRSLG